MLNTLNTPIVVLGLLAAQTDLSSFALPPTEEKQPPVLIGSKATDVREQEFVVTKEALEKIKGLLLVNQRPLLNWNNEDIFSRPTPQEKGVVYETLFNILGIVENKKIVANIETSEKGIEIKITQDLTDRKIITTCSSPYLVDFQEPVSLPEDLSRVTITTSKKTELAPFATKESEDLKLEIPPRLKEECEKFKLSHTGYYESKDGSVQISIFESDNITEEMLLDYGVVVRTDTVDVSGKLAIALHPPETFEPIIIPLNEDIDFALIHLNKESLVINLVNSKASHDQPKGMQLTVAPDRAFTVR